MGALSAFTTGNYHRQPVAVYLFVSSGKMSQSFAAVEVLMKNTFFAFSPFLYVLMGSQGCFMFFLELLMELLYCVSCHVKHFLLDIYYY